MATPPTFVAEYETAWNSTTTPKTTANFNVLSGDKLVAYAVSEYHENTIATPPGGTLAGTWVLQQTIYVSNYTYVRLWTMVVGSDQNGINVSFTRSAGAGYFGGNVLHFRNSNGIGVTNQANAASGDPAVTLNSVSANSAIVMVIGDWNAIAGAQVANESIGSFVELTTYEGDGLHYGVYGGYYSDVGAAGNKTIGQTDPNGLQWAIVAIEVLGTVGGLSIPVAMAHYRQRSN